MTTESAVIAPDPAAALAGSPAAARSSWDRIERWILAALFVFGLALPIVGAVLAAVLL